MSDLKTNTGNAQLDAAVRQLLASKGLGEQFPLFADYLQTGRLSPELTQRCEQDEKYREALDVIFDAQLQATMDRSDEFLSKHPPQQPASQKPVSQKPVPSPPARRERDSEPDSAPILRRVLVAAAILAAVLIGYVSGKSSSVAPIAGSMPNERSMATVGSGTPVTISSKPPTGLPDLSVYTSVLEEKPGPSVWSTMADNSVKYDFSKIEEDTSMFLVRVKDDEEIMVQQIRGDFSVDEVNHLRNSQLLRKLFVRGRRAERKDLVSEVQEEDAPAASAAPEPASADNE